MIAGILTFHRADNYGALFQAYSLYKVLSAMGLETELIDYRCAAIEDQYRYGVFPRLSKNPIYWPDLVKTFRAKKKQQKKCRKFRTKYICYGEAVYDDTDRSAVEEKYDLIVTGSDQIWNPSLTHGKDDWYAFKRHNRNHIVVSYAASVGGLHNFKYYYKFYEDDLLQYDMISVREQNVCEYLRKNLNRSVFLTLDPTLLLSQEQWMKLRRKTYFEKLPYILYYDVALNGESCKIAERLAQEKNYRLLHFNQWLRNSKNRKYVQEAGPEEFLSLISNAELIVTSSFHATVLAIQFEKRFLTVPHPTTGDRVKELLSALGLNSRIVEKSSIDVCSICDREIDYSQVKRQLKRYRRSSFSFLKQSIELAKTKNTL